ncbi:MAG TPA: 3-keto-5-aminohexanoate cleavage protein [Acidimicrobiia bacterium]|nr:3-keto-5-aminohexanoate cleavage protein [Acidimicrobiia bacterium]
MIPERRSLRDQGLVAIEVGLNETAAKTRNPHVPYGPGEVAPAAVAAAGAGAAVIHFHARDDAGGQLWTGHEAYRAAMAAIAEAGSDALSYPTYLSGDLSHVWALIDDPPAGPGLRFAPFDVPQHIRRVQWNHAEGRIEGMTVLGGDHSRAARPPELERFRDAGLIPSIGAFELGEVRWAVLAARSGLLATPLCLKVFLNDTWIRGPGADEAGLDAFLSQVPTDVDAEITVVPYEMADADRTWALLEAALARGHHIRVGIGDNPGAFPTATNAELVERAVELAAKHGLEPASPAQVLERFGSTPLR